MKSICFFFLFLCLGASIPSYGQKKKVYTIDEKKVLLNKNLDYYVKRLKVQKFTPLKSKKELPKFIKTQLPYFNDQSLADTGERYVGADISSAALPERKLVFAAKSKEVYVLTYVKGGAEITDHLVFIKYIPGKVLDVWSGRGCMKCRSIKHILSYINSTRGHVFGLNNELVDP